jgi:hypothetical protein
MPRKIFNLSGSEKWIQIISLSFSFFFLCSTASAQKHVLDEKMHHLRKGVNPEWDEFPLHAEDSQLVIHFKSLVNTEDATIYLRQYDVSQGWQVLLNNKKIGELTLDEKDMMSYFTIPRGSLSAGDNILYIGSPDTDADRKNHVSDDIRIGQIELEYRPVKDLLSESTMDIEVWDRKIKRTIPSRITIVNMAGVLQQINIKPAESLAVRTGVIYTGSGSASFGLAAGRYKIYASRGFEYGVDSVIVVLKPGDHIQKKLVIRREVDTKGWISSDTHIHTLTYSGHGDATVEERVLTIAGEGLELPIITDHNIAIDIKPVVEKMRMDSFFIPVTGNEVTTRVGHFNIFPVSSAAPVTDHEAKDWSALFKQIDKTPGIEAIILNHARDSHDGFRPLDPKHHIAVAGMSLTGWTFLANAMEVMNSGSQQTDPMQLCFDWFGMMNHGYFLTPVGSSDSHDVSRYMVGQARTYIRSKEDDVNRIDVKEVLKNFADGKVMVSFGLLTEIMVAKKYGPGELVHPPNNVEVSIRVMGPRWVKANRIILYANGQKIREANISPNATGSVKWKGTWILPRPQQDLFLVAIAEGPAIRSPFWPIAKPFQHLTGKLNPLVIGLSGAVWIDGDGNGNRTSAYEYAKVLWNSSKGDISVLIKKLALYDESVAIQAAAILTENGINVQAPEILQALTKASSKTNSGFRRFLNELKASEVNRQWSTDNKQ